MAQPLSSCWSVVGASQGLEVATTQKSEPDSFIDALKEVAERVKNLHVS